MCAGSWNEIDELIFNSTNGGSVGPTYGTSLFVSKPPPAAASQSQGFGAAAAVGLFSNHDKTGTCAAAGGYASLCTAAACAAGTCPGAPLCCPTVNTTLVAKGVPAAVAGGGAPAYTQSIMAGFQNYKLIWTPTWLAWMINDVVMRNETSDARSGAIPWRPVGMRPLIRTGNGSAPIIFGISGGELVSVPAGAIYSTADGSMISTAATGNYIEGANVSKCTITTIPTTAAQLTAALAGAVCTGTVDLSKNKVYTDFVTSSCMPCNLGVPNPTTGAFTIASKTQAITSAAIYFYPQSSVSIRRVRYTPYNTESVAQAIVTNNTWSANPVIPVTQCIPTPGSPPTAAAAAPAGAKATVDPVTGTVSPAASVGETPPGQSSITAAPAFTAEPVGKTSGVAGLPGGSGNPVQASSLTIAQLLDLTAGQCHYIEGAFEDDFNSPALNVARWIPEGSANPPKTWAVSATGKYNTSAVKGVPSSYGEQIWGGYQVCTHTLRQFLLF